MACRDKRQVRKPAAPAPSAPRCRSADQSDELASLHGRPQAQVTHRSGLVGHFDRAETSFATNNIRKLAMS